MKLQFLPFFNVSLGLHRFFLKKDNIDRTTSFIDSDKILAANNEEQEINNALLDKKNLVEIILKNGNSIIVEEDNLVYSFSKSWKKAKDLNEYDLILNKIDLAPLDMGVNQSLIGFNNIVKGKIMPVYIPEYNNPRLSEWIGFISAHGEVNIHNEIAVVIEDPALADYYCKLTKESLNITPLSYKDKRGNRSTRWSFISKNAANFVKQFLGKKYGIRKVPSFIMEATLQDQLEYVKGVSAYAYKERKSVVVYKGISKPISDFCALVLRSSGYQISVQPRKMKHGVIIYFVRMIGHYKKFHPFEFYNPDCHFIFEKFSTDKVWFKEKWVEYQTLAKRSRKLSEINLEYFYCGIREVKLLGEKECMVIRLLNPVGMSYNQVVLSGCP